MKIKINTHRFVYQMACVFLAVLIMFCVFSPRLSVRAADADVGSDYQNYVVFKRKPLVAADCSNRTQCLS